MTAEKQVGGSRRFTRSLAKKSRTLFRGGLQSICRSPAFQLNFFLLLLTIVFVDIFFSSRQDTSTYPVCIFGNAGDLKDAERVYHTWDQKFPVVFYNWDLKEPEKLGKSKSVRLVSDGKDYSYRDGVEFALNRTRELYSCEYYFLHDDDLEFSLNKEVRDASGYKPLSRLSEELLDVLNIYKPFFATFIWGSGAHHPGLSQTIALHKNSRVMPFVAGDSGMTIYHRDIVDFFIPMSPNGEGGFVGNWTLPTHFIDLFAGQVFDGVVVNSIQYKNTKNPDNLSKAKANWTVTKDGLAVNSVSRHAYEWPRNEAYLSFLYDSARHFDMNRARSRVVFSPVSPPVVSQQARIVESIQRLNSLFDVRHPALSSSAFLQRPSLKQALLSQAQKTPFNLRVTIITYQRFHIALELIRAVSAEFQSENHFLSDDATVSMHVMLDRDESGSDEARDRFVSDAKSLYPDITFSVAATNRGLRNSWMENWTPRTLDSFNIVLEDDLKVSPNLLRTAVDLIREVFYKEEFVYDEVIGISLFNDLKSDIPIKVSDETEAELASKHTLRQVPCSWGAVFTAYGWREFTKWSKKQSKDYDPLLKDALSNRWPTANSWKKFALRFMAEKNMFMYYPRFPKGESAVVKLQTVGTNDKGNFKDISEGLELLSRPLPRVYAPLQANRYDYKLEPVAGDYDSFDGCTLVMPICYRLAVLPELLEHYSKVPFLAQLIVVHQACGVGENLTVPASLNGMEVIYKRMTTNDMNNRYIDFDEIKYDCVINLDDDVKHPYQAMQTLITMWKTHFFDHYVGWEPQARIHVIQDNQYQYKNYSWVETYDGLSSMLLPSGSVFHRKFLTAYNAPANKPSRDIVTRETNCDDILMNFVIANATGNGPIVLHDWSALQRSESMKELSNDNSSAQWKQSDHMQKRSSCMNQFTELYGRMPLRYAVSQYKVESSVSSYPILVQMKPLEMILFSERLFPNRRTAKSVPDLCEISSLSSELKAMACTK